MKQAERKQAELNKRKFIVYCIVQAVRSGNKSHSDIVDYLNSHNIKSMRDCEWKNGMLTYFVGKNVEKLKEVMPWEEINNIFFASNYRTEDDLHKKRQAVALLGAAKRQNVCNLIAQSIKSGAIDAHQIAEYLQTKKVKHQGGYDYNSEDVAAFMRQNANKLISAILHCNAEIQ